MGRSKRKQMKGLNVICFRDAKELDIVKPNHKMTDAEFAIFQGRYNRYNETLAEETARAYKELGYNFHKCIALDHSKKIGLLPVGKSSHLQKINIPMRESLVDSLLSCKKFIVKENSSQFESRGIIQMCSRKVLIGQTPLGPVQFLVVNTQGVTNKNTLTRDFSTSLYCMLQGKDPMFLYRHDNSARSAHFNRFNEEGELIREKELTADEIKYKYKGAHEHKYSQKYCAVFSNPFLLEHGDIVPAIKYKNSVEYWEEFAKRFNIQPTYIIMRGDKTVQDVLNKIKDLQIRENNTTYGEEKKGEELLEHAKKENLVPKPLKPTRK